MARGTCSRHHRGAVHYRSLKTQSALAETDVLPTTDNQVIEQLYIEQATGCHQLSGNLDVVYRRSRLARWMIMYHDNARTVAPYCLFENLSNSNSSRIKTANIHCIDLLDAIFRVEQDGTEMLLIEMTHFDHQERCHIGR